VLVAAVSVTAVAVPLLVGADTEGGTDEELSFSACAAGCELLPAFCLFAITLIWA
jgi:hypothetical protein